MYAQEQQWFLKMQASGSALLLWKMYQCGYVGSSLFLGWALQWPCLHASSEKL
jgi:hypothetical protein